MSSKRAFFPATACLALLGTLLCAHGAAASDRYDAALKHAGRSSADLTRDPKDQAAALLRLTGIKPGMHVLDMLGANGYYSELVSYIVGPQGSVLLVNDPSFDAYDTGWKERLAGDRLPNVTHRVVDLSAMQLGTAKFDAALLIKVYHDLYWEDLIKGPPRTDAKTILDQVAASLKPGAVLLVVDHSAKAGSGAADAGTLHRIDAAYARHDIESHGFQFVKEVNFLHDPADDRSMISYKEPMLGKTDRFVYVFRKEP